VALAAERPLRGFARREAARLSCQLLSDWNAERAWWGGTTKEYLRADRLPPRRSDARATHLHPPHPHAPALRTDGVGTANNACGRPSSRKEKSTSSQDGERPNPAVLRTTDHEHRVGHVRSGSCRGWIVGVQGRACERRRGRRSARRYPLVVPSYRALFSVPIDGSLTAQARRLPRREPPKGARRSSALNPRRSSPGSSPSARSGPFC
jgi:hypothetical protein